MNITTQKNSCLGCGMCASLAPNLFSINTGSIEIIKDPKTWTDEDWKAAKEAAKACPNSVISITS